MARLAIFVDGGYYSALAEKHYHVRIEFPKLVEEIRSVIAAQSQFVIPKKKSLIMANSTPSVALRQGTLLIDVSLTSHNLTLA